MMHFKRNRMKYFCKNNERDGGDYLEFRKGNLYSDEHWLDSSAYICEDAMYEIGLVDAVCSVISNFDTCGAPVCVSKKQWNMIKQNITNKDAFIAVEEISSWVDSNFIECDFFVIMGI